MNKVICAWCKSSNTEKQPVKESVKFEEYVCQDCHHSTWHQTDYDINKLPKKTEFLMLDPDSFFADSK